MGTHKGLVQRIERKLEVTVGDAFARVFGGSIVPEEVEAMLRREAADGVRSLQGNRLLAPNEYVITVGAHDYEKLGTDPDITAETFAKQLAGYIGEQGWQTYGPVVVRFEQSPSLHTGQFRTRGVVNPDVEPRPAAHDVAPPQSDHALSAEPGVPPMTENSSYRGGQGQGRPGDEYYDDRYGRPQDDPRGGQESRGGQEARGGYPPESGGYPPSGYPPRPRNTAHTPTRVPTPTKAGTTNAAMPIRAATQSSAATPTSAAIRSRAVTASRRDTPIRAVTPIRAGRLPAAVRATSPAGYGAPATTRGIAKAATARPPAWLRRVRLRSRASSARRGRGLRPARARRVPEPGYEGYGPGYGRQDYGPPDYGRYGEPVAGTRLPVAGTRSQPPGTTTTANRRGRVRRVRGDRLCVYRQDGHTAARRRQRADLSAARRQQHHRPWARRPIPAARHRCVAPSPGDQVGRAGRAANRPELHQRHHRQQRAGTGMAAGRRRRDPVGPLGDHRPLSVS
ncbi:hypothetical protein I553_8738 [Mycobacterium xenopi 4042]|uniref:FhaA N-terminal domain-containing protein n=1 Tax=Mycobacterium xenopi 4042 TaxID=1299334 RepID=X8CLH1_MYCXE|nr:hypothetical protein I553_8738 [Mycobacterium xenopi 4042]